MYKNILKPSFLVYSEGKMGIKKGKLNITNLL